MLEITLLDLFVDLAHAGSSAAAPTSVSATQPTHWLPWGVEVLPIVRHGFRLVPTPPVFPLLSTGPNGDMAMRPSVVQLLPALAFHPLSSFK